jgi:DNA-binding NtrC family response regulator/tetratricopeptide (TPR) repeat protein
MQDRDSGTDHNYQEIGVDFASDLSDLQRLIASGQHAIAKGKYRAIADRVRCSGEEEEQLVLEFFKAQILAGEDDYPSAIELADKLLSRFRDLNLRHKAARCHLLLSGLLLRTAAYWEAKAHAEAAIYFCTWEIEDKALLGDAHNDLGLALKDLGMWDEAERSFRSAIDAYAAVEDPIRNLRASLNLSILLRKIGRVTQAKDICRRGMELAEELEVPIGVCRYALELANISVINRDVDEGRSYLKVAKDIAETKGYEREKILAVEIEGDLLDLEGDPEVALGVYMVGLERARALAKDGDLEAELLRRAAATSLRTGNVLQARRFVDEALSLTDKAHDKYEYGVCLRILGESQIADGMTGTGIEHLEESVHVLSDLSVWCHELAVSHVVLGRALLQRSKRRTAAAGVDHLLSARRIHSNLGISSAVRQLDEMILASVATTTAEKTRRPTGHGAGRLAASHRLDPAQYGVITDDERIIDDLARWGPTEARILIEGETGVGKELMARALHALSRRREGAFVAVDCGALSESLADSELFGHARGAFTGAMKDRIGLIESANGGTLLLDEIGELSEALQVKLLRVLEEGVVRRVGENSPRRIDVRVISATARDLWSEVEAGSFRRDLYYRLKTVLIRIPSLRERPPDIELLLDHYMHLYNECHGTKVTLGAAARKDLSAYGWPGNVRELKNVVEALILSHTDGDAIRAEHVKQFLSDRSSEIGLKGQIAGLEREEIERALKACGGNKTKAAKMLGISRKTLWSKLKLLDSS